MGLLPVLAALGIWRWVAVSGDEPKQVSASPSAVPSATPTEALPAAAPTVEPVAEETTPPAATGGKLQVLNGSGTPGLALKAKEKLEQSGYEVVATSNASRSYAKTTVFYQEGHLDLATQVAALLGASKVEAAPSNLDKDIGVTAVIGADYKP